MKEETPVVEQPPDLSNLDYTKFAEAFKEFKVCSSVGIEKVDLELWWRGASVSEVLEAYDEAMKIAVKHQKTVRLNLPAGMTLSPQNDSGMEVG